jgi:hypothetical protein
LSHLQSPFSFTYFSELASDCSPPTSASCIAGISDMPHHVYLVGRDVGLTFCPM